MLNSLYINNIIYTKETAIEFCTTAKTSLKIPSLTSGAGYQIAQHHPLSNHLIKFVGTTELLVTLLTSVKNSVLLSRKQPGQPLMATIVTGQQPSSLFYATDSLTGLCFLVDTGADISIIPPSVSERKHRKDNFSLQAVNNTPIVTYGTQLRTTNIGLRSKF